LAEQLMQHKPGDTITLEVLRDGKTLEPTDGGVFSLLAVRD